jgi:hypothetical protein
MLCKSDTMIEQVFVKYNYCRSSDKRGTRGSQMKKKKKRIQSKDAFLIA